MDIEYEESLIKSILLASDITDRVNRMDLYELNKWLNKVTGQNIPDIVARNAMFDGISNMEYLTGAYLSNRNYKNLLQCKKLK